MLVKSQVKEFIKKELGEGGRVSQGVMEAAELQLKAILVRAAHRTKGNGRKTMKEQDL
jgi:histone H3/H4